MFCVHAINILICFIILLWHSLNVLYICSLFGRLFFPHPENSKLNSKIPQNVPRKWKLEIKKKTQQILSNENIFQFWNDRRKKMERKHLQCILSTIRKSVHVHLLSHDKDCVLCLIPLQHIYNYTLHVSCVFTVCAVYNINVHFHKIHNIIYHFYNNLWLEIIFIKKYNVLHIFSDSITRHHVVAATELIK